MYTTTPESSLLTLVIPAYNEEASLSRYIPELLQYAENHQWMIILVDDGSKDQTAAILSTYESHECLRIIRHKLNRGYGGALKTGIRNVQTRYCVTIDADGQHDLDDVAKMLETMVAQDADLLVGNRRGSKASGWYRELGKSIIRGVAKLMMPLTIYDINSGMKMYNTQLVKQYIPLCPDTMAFSDIITLTFIYSRHLVIEQPININKRHAGESTIGLSTAFNTLIEIINIVILFNPMRIFLPLSLTSIAAALIWDIPILIKGHGFSVGGLLGFTTGLIFFALGLIAEQLGNIRRQSVQINH